MKLKLSVILALSAITTAQAQEPVFDKSGRFQGNYVCKADAVTGIQYDETTRRWEGMVYNPDGVKYAVRVVAGGIGPISFFGRRSDGMYYGVFFKVPDQPEVQCYAHASTLSEAMITGIFENGDLDCEYNIQFKFNLLNLRYVRTLNLGYRDGKDQVGDMPYAELGRCEKIN